MSQRVNRPGFVLIVIFAIVTGLTAQRSPTAVETRIDVLKEKLDRGEKVLIIDVRREDEVKPGSIPGAVNISMAELEARMKDISKDVQVVFVCDHGNRSSLAAEMFEKKGYKASTFCALEGWKAKGYKVAEIRRPDPGPIKP
jgi:rhodanese-related sulfurtransferase